MLSLLTSKLAGLIGIGLSLALGVALIAVLIAKNNVISSLEDHIEELTTANTRIKNDNVTLKGNAQIAEAGLAACNAGVRNTQMVTDALTKSGTAAVKQVQQAGAKAAQQAAAIQAMPQATCEDAFAILKAGGK